MSASIPSDESSSDARAQEAAVFARGVVRRFGDVTALDRFDLDVPKGGIFGLIGPDGAGKTTLMRLLGGLLRADSGDLRVLGRDPWKDPGAVRPQLGYMPQRFALYPDLEVVENLRFYGDLFGVIGAQFQARREELLAWSRLAPFAHRRAGQLSGGMKQKLALCAALLHHPQLLLLDEPTTGVDPISRREFWGLLRAIVAERTTIVIATPYMDEAQRCDRVVMMAAGANLAAGTPAELLAGFPLKLIDVRTRNPVRVRNRCAALAGVRSAQAMGDHVHVTGVDEAALIALLRDELSSEGVTPADISPVRPSMDDLFVHLFAERGGARAA